MKKIAIFALALTATALMSACGGKTDGGSASDSTAVDSAQTEATETEGESAEKPASNVIETEYFTLTLPEGWTRNGEEGKYKADLKTTDNVPTYYATIEVLDYVESIDEWKGNHISKSLKPDGTMTVGDYTFTVMAEKAAFYTLNMATMLPGEKGAYIVSFHGDADKDINEQKELLKKLVEAVVIK